MVAKDGAVIIFQICSTNLKSIVINTTKSKEYVRFVAFAQIIIVIYEVKYDYAWRRDAMSTIIPSIETSK